MQAADLKRQRRALAQIEKKELASVQQALRREHRQEWHKQQVHSPTFALALGPPGRPADPDKAAKRYTSEVKQALEAEDEKRLKREKKRRIDLIDAFTRAASDDDDDGGGGDNSVGPKPPNKPSPDRGNRRKTRRRRRDKDFDRGM